MKIGIKGYFTVFVLTAILSACNANQAPKAKVQFSVNTPSVISPSMVRILGGEKSEQQICSKSYGCSKDVLNQTRCEENGENGCFSAFFDDLDANVTKTLKRLQANPYSGIIYTVRCDGNKMTQVCVSKKSEWIKLLLTKCYSENRAIDYLNKEPICQTLKCKQTKNPEQLSSKDLDSACGVASKKYEKVRGSSH